MNPNATTRGPKPRALKPLNLETISPPPLPHTTQNLELTIPSIALTLRERLRKASKSSRPWPCPSELAIKSHSSCRMSRRRFTSHVTDGYLPPITRAPITSSPVDKARTNLSASSTRCALPQASTLLIWFMLTSASLESLENSHQGPLLSRWSRFSKTSASRTKDFLSLLLSDNLEVSEY